MYLYVYIERERERDCFYYIIMQSYDVGLHSRRHPMEFDAGTSPFASFDAPIYIYIHIYIYMRGI